MNREQELINICYELVLTITSKSHVDIFKKKNNEEKAKWVRKQLINCGFPTKPCGSSWGVSNG